MRRLLTTLTTLLILTMAHGQGIPFIRNFTAEEYHANNTNYDIDIDENGNVFVANFEGLLYYDHADWRIIRTPGISRVTVVYRATDNTIFVGGYNYFGKVVRKANGELMLKRIGKADMFRGEVTEIYESDGKLLFLASDATIYRVDNEQLAVYQKVDQEAIKMGMLDVVDVKALESGKKDITRNDTVQVEPLGHGLQAIVIKNSGLIIADNNHRMLYTITDANGLCSNNISYVAYDGHGHLWGATARGIFAVHVPTAFFRFGTYEGLAGTILSIESLNGKIYAGTDEGLYCQAGYRFVKLPNVPHACWDLKKSGNGLLAATADGIYRIYSDGKVSHLTTTHTLSLLDDGSCIYSGETDGVYLIQANGQNRRRMGDVANVRRITKDREGTIWAQSLYGTVWYKKADSSTFVQHKKGMEGSESMQTIVMTGGLATIVSAESTTPFPYPLTSYVDDSGVTWLTDNEGKNLYRWKDGQRLDDMNRLLLPIGEMPIRSIYTSQNEIWLGNDNGLTVIYSQAQDPSLSTNSEVWIRSVVLGSDSILWGGFGTMPEMLPTLGSRDNNLHFTFSLNFPPATGRTLYRYRLNNGRWSAWSPNTSAVFSNLTFGSYIFEVQALDVLNHETDITSIRFAVSPPFYLKWYMILLYLLLLTALLFAFFRLRLRRLEKEKIRLEKIVQERSAQVVRLEKMATVGKLTQGLIDRIFNPLNYIINFTKLSEGLVRDVKANIEDEKDHFDEENYDDTIDVLGTLTMNLQKVGEHGQNTTRILKSMEEILKDRSGNIVSIDLMDVIHHDEEMLQQFFQQEILQYGITIDFDDHEGPLPIKGNADLLSKTIMGILSNAVYAVVRKAQKQQAGAQGKEAEGGYTPEITLRVARQKEMIRIGIRDNGIGIEPAILSKIFDPFFTTKTTSEAAGVGLYLSREIIQNHGGDIQVKSEKDKYCEFTITLPVI